MPVHDWTRVEAGIFHAFHTTWVAEIQNAFNEGVLPEGYYALPEQHRPSTAEAPWAPGQGIADVLTLHASTAFSDLRLPPLPTTGGTAVAEVEIYLEHLAPGAPLAEMPLFLTPDRYVSAPLESTYGAAYRGMPAFWRGVLEGPPSSVRPGDG